ncbi:MAG: sel1 repeat family protein [Ignavibacteriales bacterium]|nr:sel1 repeat family protein [Ignavibacteriales bacterium]
MRFIYTIVTILFITSFASLAQPRNKSDEEGKESLAKKNKQWYMSLYRIYIPDYSYKFQESFYLVQKANAGDPFAQHELGLRYLIGDGFETDTLKSILWIRKAADQELPSASYNLAIFYNNGFKDQWDPFMAFRYFQRAAQYGMTEAEFAVGVFFTENLVMEKNIDSAFYWIKRSAGKGFAPAIDALGKLRENYLELKTTVDPANGKAATKTAYVQDSSVIAKFNKKSTGTLSMDFMDIGRDSSSIPSDSAYFIRLIKNEHGDIKENLGLYKEDSLELLSSGEILHALSVSAEAGSPDANLYLGRFYEKGMKPDMIKALVYFLRAYRLESPLSPVMINRMIDNKNIMAEVYRQTEKRNPDALFVFAALNSMGYSSVLTPELLLKYLRDAASKKHVPALLEAGQLEFTGRVTKPDTAAARAYWATAEGLGAREGALRMLFTKIVSQNTCDAAGRAYLMDADSLGSILAQTALGLIFEKGIGVEADKKTAIKYYRKAGYRGSSIAFLAIRRMYNSLRPEEEAFKLGKNDGVE